MYSGTIRTGTTRTFTGTSSYPRERHLASVTSRAIARILVGWVPGSEWILHGCDFGCDSDVNFRCEDYYTVDYTILYCRLTNMHVRALSRDIVVPTTSIPDTMHVPYLLCSLCLYCKISSYQ